MQPVTANSPNKHWRLLVNEIRKGISAAHSSTSCELTGTQSPCSDFRRSDASSSESSCSGAYVKPPSLYCAPDKPESCLRNQIEKLSSNTACVLNERTESYSSSCNDIELQRLEKELCKKSSGSPDRCYKCCDTHLNTSLPMPDVKSTRLETCSETTSFIDALPKLCQPPRPFGSLSKVRSRPTLCLSSQMTQIASVTPSSECQSVRDSDPSSMSAHFPLPQNPETPVGLIQGKSFRRSPTAKGVNSSSKSLAKTRPTISAFPVPLENALRPQKTRRHKKHHKRRREMGSKQRRNTQLVSRSAAYRVASKCAIKEKRRKIAEEYLQVSSQQ